MPSSTTSLPTSFNTFLFATVCEGRDEHPVSVISALARLDLDPWTEAAELASMPAGGAAERLSSLLAGVADGPAALHDRETIAERLVGLLPIPAKTNIKPGLGTANLLGSSYLQSVLIMWMIILASMAVSAWIAPTPASDAHAPAAKPIVAATTGR
jgi:hypothetical protein